MADGDGRSLRRIEDHRFLTGTGLFSDDVAADDAAWAVFVRSPHAHARITSIDGSAATSAPGVVGVLTAADIAADGLGHMPCLGPVEGKGGSQTIVPPNPLLAASTARHVGDPIFLVVADTLHQAKDAAEKLVVNFEALASVNSTAEALDPQAPQIWPEAPGNIAVDWECGDATAVRKAFSHAAHTVAVNVGNNRIAVSPIEPRAALASYDEAAAQYRLTTPTQGAHGVRSQIAENVLRLDPERLHIVTPDVGGGFGARYYCNREQIAVAWASKRLGRPVRWCAERSECFFADGQARDHISSGELALDVDGRILALRVSAVANMGAYIIHWGPCIPTDIGCEVLTGPYRIPAAHANVKCVFTNMVPIDAYRGTGRAEFIYLLERLIDRAARKLNLEPDVLRQRNFIRPEAMPYTTPTAQVYDTGDYDDSMHRAMQAANWDGFPARRDDVRAEGRLSGIGMSTYVMSAAGLLDEQARLRLDDDGGISAFVGTQSTGQGHATAYAQIISQATCVPTSMIRIFQGDSGLCPAGGGTGQSRSLLMGGLAIRGAINGLLNQAQAVASRLMQAGDDRISFSKGAFVVAAGARSMSLAEIAQTLAAEDNERPLVSSYLAEQAPMTFPHGCHICELTVDPETGAIDIVKYTTVDDFGTVLNPMMCEGQVHGATVQGIGQALLEQVVHDADSGQLLTGSFMDYCLPRADDVPMIGSTLVEDAPCTTNTMGVKGSGEAGAIAAPAAVINALLDALAELGVDHIDMPVTLENVWRVIQSAGDQSVS